MPEVQTFALPILGAEFLTDEIIEELANEVVVRTAVLFDAIKPKGGEMPVVMGAGGSGILYTKRLVMLSKPILIAKTPLSFQIS